MGSAQGRMVGAHLRIGPTHLRTGSTQRGSQERTMGAVTHAGRAHTNSGAQIEADRLTQLPGTKVETGSATPQALVPVATSITLPSRHLLVCTAGAQDGAQPLVTDATIGSQVGARGV